MDRCTNYSVFAVLVGSMVLFSGSCAGIGKIPVENERPFVVEGSPVWGALGNEVNLDQGWSQEVQQYWYITPQGTQIMPYAWFMALEQSANQTLFRSNDNITRLRFIPQGATPLNPDALPVGFAIDVNDPDFEEGSAEWFGVNCSACHTAQIEFNGQAIRIDGGPTLADFNTFFKELVESLEATRDETGKFDRFAKKVLGTPAPSGPATNSLRRDLAERTAYLRKRLDINTPPFEAGYARLDAVGNIFNAVFGQDLDGPPPNDVNSPPNTAPANAPVSYPALWDAPHTNLVQWAGFVNNKAPGGPTARNLGEVLGVFATFSFHQNSRGEGYQSSVRVKKQLWLERWVTSLWSPQWPEQYLGSIDRTVAEQGRALYAANCQRCHTVLADRTDPDRGIAAQMFPLDSIGTDSLNAVNFVNRATGSIKTGKIEGRLSNYFEGDSLLSETAGSQVLTHAVAGILWRKPLPAGASVISGLRASLPDVPEFDPKSYRARPLNGVWATAPYLHNGSVPSLWELLKPGPERVTTFRVGNREFDPVNVGFVTTAAPGVPATLLDTSEPGNSNAGHEYGTQLTEDERRALVEYIKSL